MIKPSNGRRMSFVIRVLTLLAFVQAAALPGQQKARRVVPLDFDLALERADIVCVGRAVRERDRTKTLLVSEVLHRAQKRGTRAGDATIDRVTAGSRLAIDDLQRFGVHVRLPVDGRSYLVFAQWTGRRWTVQQQAGSLNVWRPRHAEAVRSLTRLSAELIESRRSGASKKQRAEAALDLLINFAQQHRNSASIAAAALRVIARQTAGRVDIKHVAQLRSLLRDSALGLRVRDGAARCLAASDPGLSAELKSLLAAARSPGLGRLFGRLIMSNEGEASVDRLTALLPTAAPGAHSEIIMAIAACGPQGKQRLQRLASDPKLPATLRGALRQLAR